MSELQMVLALSVVAGILAFVALRYWGRYRKLRDRFKGVLDVEGERDKLVQQKEALMHQVNDQRSRWEGEFTRTVSQLEDLTKQLDMVRDTVEMQSFGLYETEFDFGTSDEYKDAIREVREFQKEMIRKKTAAVCHVDWSVEGSKVKGRQMVNRQLRLQLRAFNGESGAAILNVRYNNVVRMEERIEKAVVAINKLGETQSCSLFPIRISDRKKRTLTRIAVSNNL